jgi:hypothetical protein
MQEGKREWRLCSQLGYLEEEKYDTDDPTNGKVDEET